MKAKKHLGQHFLHEKGVLKTIRDTLNPAGNDIVVEIGPGTGNLTAEILPLAGKVIALEKDPDMVTSLKERFHRELVGGNLEIVEDDALSFNVESLRLYKNHDYLLVGNIPYNITGALLEYFLSASYQPVRAVFLTQREVSERIIARDGKESILSLSVKIYGTPSIIQTIGRGAFTPPPKVESAILAIANISRKKFENRDEEELFFEIIKTGFAHKRKIAMKNLSDYFTHTLLDELWNTLSLDKKIRPEDIHLDTWIAITKFIYNKGSTSRPS